MSNIDLKSFWDKRVDEWNKQAEDVDNYYTKRNNYIIGLIIRNVKSGKVLDVGCGAGALSIKLLERGYDVYGVDISENMIQKTIERTSKIININNINDRFRVCKSTSIPFKDSAFKILILIGVILYAENYSRYLKFISRYIEPNGYLVVSSTNRCSFYVFKEALNHLREFSTQKKWVVVLKNLIRTGLWSGGNVNYKTAKQAYSSAHFDRICENLGLMKKDEINLFAFNRLDANPLARNRFMKFLSRRFGWNHIGLFQKVNK